MSLGLWRYSKRLQSKLTHSIFSLFELCNTARPSQQQLSSCSYFLAPMNFSFTKRSYYYTQEVQEPTAYRSLWLLRPRRQSNYEIFETFYRRSLVRAASRHVDITPHRARLTTPARVFGDSVIPGRGSPHARGRRLVTGDYRWPL